MSVLGKALRNYCGISCQLCYFRLLFYLMLSRPLWHMFYNLRLTVFFLNRALDELNSLSKFIKQTFIKTNVQFYEP